MAFPVPIGDNAPMTWDILVPTLTLVAFGVFYCFAAVHELVRCRSGEALRKATEKMGIGLGLFVLGTGMLVQQLVPNEIDFGILIWGEVALVAIVYVSSTVLG